MENETTEKGTAPKAFEPTAKQLHDLSQAVRVAPSMFKGTTAGATALRAIIEAAQVVTADFSAKAALFLPPEQPKAPDGPMVCWKCKGTIWETTEAASSVTKRCRTCACKYITQRTP